MYSRGGFLRVFLVAVSFRSVWMAARMCSIIADNANVLSVSNRASDRLFEHTLRNVFNIFQCILETCIVVNKIICQSDDLICAFPKIANGSFLYITYYLILPFFYKCDSKILNFSCVHSDEQN